METRRTWILNFNAEAELAALPLRAAPPAAGSMTAASIPTSARKWAEVQLLGPGDLVLTPNVTRECTAGTVGLAWCPTPSAVARLQAAGASVPPAPPTEVLRLVNHRRFCAELGSTLEGAAYLHALADVDAWVREPSPSGDWLLKRAFGCAGQGRLGVSPGPLSAAARAFVETSLRSGDGLAVEPWVRREADFSRHAFMAIDGTDTFGAAVVQEVTSGGSWRKTRIARPGELSGTEAGALEDALQQSVGAARSAGYFGPIGIDAFRWRAPNGRLHFCARCEINARYSMGWVIGLAPLRPDLHPGG